MPELPEVETVLKGLRMRVPGRKILEVEVKNRRIVRPISPKKFTGQISGKTILSLSRIGKWLCFHLSDDINLWAHLGMTGRFLWNKPDAYSRVIFHLDNDNTLYFSNIRTLGRLMIALSDSAEPPEVKLGLDPINDKLTGQYLYGHFRNHSITIKDMLLRQDVIAGIGNIYATEILFDAKLHPFRPSNSLSKQECKTLAKSIVSSLKKAIEYGGTTISDFLTLEGESGGFQAHIRIYGNQGNSCPECGTTLERYVLHGRSGVFCPKCQH